MSSVPVYVSSRPSGSRKKPTSAYRKALATTGRLPRRPVKTAASSRTPARSRRAGDTVGAQVRSAGHDPRPVGQQRHLRVGRAGTVSARRQPLLDHRSDNLPFVVGQRRRMEVAGHEEVRCARGALSRHTHDVVGPVHGQRLDAHPGGLYGSPVSTCADLESFVHPRGFGDRPRWLV